MRYDPILCMMVDEPAKAQDELSLAQKKQVVTELKGYLKKSYNFSDESEYARAYEDLRHMFTTGSRKSISGLFENTVKKTGAHDANTLYETFAHGNSKHAGVLEMNGKAKVVVWNEGDNPRTGKVTVIGEDTPANRSKAKSMLDSAKTKDESYIVKGRKYKVVKRDGNNVTVLGPDGKVTKMDIDFLMSEGVKTKDRLVKVPDNKLKDFEANLRSAGFKVVSKSDRGRSTHYQVEVSSDKEFTKDDLREWANKIDAVCDKMDSVAPTTWNIGLTADGKITAGLDVREMYVKDSASALDKAISTCDAASGDAMKQIASAK